MVSIMLNPQIRKGEMPMKFADDVSSELQIRLAARNARTRRGSNQTLQYTTERRTVSELNNIIMSPFALVVFFLNPDLLRYQYRTTNWIPVE